MHIFPIKISNLKIEHQNAKKDERKKTPIKKTAIRGRTFYGGLVGLGLGNKFKDFLV